MALICVIQVPDPIVAGAYFLFLSERKHLRKMQFHPPILNMATDFEKQIKQLFIA